MGLRALRVNLKGLLIKEFCLFGIAFLIQEIAEVDNGVSKVRFHIEGLTVSFNGLIDPLGISLGEVKP